MRICRLLTALLLATLAPLAARAQGYQTNRLLGYVGDYGLQPGATNYGITLTVLSPKSRIVNGILVRDDPKTVYPDVNGAFAFTNIQYGRYQLSVDGKFGTAWVLVVYTNDTGNIPIGARLWPPGTAALPIPDPAGSYYTKPQVDALFSAAVVGAIPNVLTNRSPNNVLLYSTNATTAGGITLVSSNSTQPVLDIEGAPTGGPNGERYHITFRDPNGVGNPGVDLNTFITQYGGGCPPLAAQLPVRSGMYDMFCDTDYGLQIAHALPWAFAYWNCLDVGAAQMVNLPWYPYGFRSIEMHGGDSYGVGAYLNLAEPWQPGAIPNSDKPPLRITSWVADYVHNTNYPASAVGIRLLDSSASHFTPQPLLQFGRIKTANGEAQSWLNASVANETYYPMLTMDMTGSTAKLFANGGGLTNDAGSGYAPLSGANMINANIISPVLVTPTITGATVSGDINQQHGNLNVWAGAGSFSGLTSTNGFIATGDQNHTNALVVTPSGVTISNAIGSLAIQSGNITPSGTIFASTSPGLGANQDLYGIKFAGSSDPAHPGNGANINCWGRDSSWFSIWGAGVRLEPGHGSPYINQTYQNLTLGNEDTWGSVMVNLCSDGFRNTPGKSYPSQPLMFHAQHYAGPGGDDAYPYFVGIIPTSTLRASDSLSGAQAFGQVWFSPVGIENTGVGVDGSGNPASGDPFVGAPGAMDPSTNSHFTFGLREFDVVITATNGLNMLTNPIIASRSAWAYTNSYATNPTVALDFSGTDLQTVYLFGNMSFYSTNFYAAPLSTRKRFLLKSGGSSPTLTFPASWNWMGSAFTPASAPITSMTNNCVMQLTLTTIGVGETNVMAEALVAKDNSTYAYAPSWDASFTTFSNTVGQLTTAESYAVNGLVTQLKAAGLWSRIDALYPFVGSTTTKCKYNLKNPAQYTITWTGTPVCNGSGVAGDGSTIWGLTGFNPSTAGGNYAQNSASVFVYMVTALSAGQSAYGAVGNNTGTPRATLKFNNSAMENPINDPNLSDGNNTHGSIKGPLLSVRTDSGNHYLYSQFATYQWADASVNIPNDQFAIMGTKFAGDTVYYQTGATIGGFQIGGAFNATEAAQLMQIWDQFAMTLGRYAR